MLRPALWKLLLLLFPLQLTAQPETFTLDGYLGVESGETFSYRLVFTDSAGSLKGHAVTYLREANDTKAMMTGTIDRKQKTLSFTETGILYNNGFRSNAIICLVKATLKYLPEKNGFVLSGPVTSRDAGNASCSRGSIRFENEAVLQELFREKIKDTVKMPVTRTVVTRPGLKPVVQTLLQNTGKSLVVTEEITAGVEKIYDWHTDTIVLEVWDGGRIDGDIITVRYNGHSILTRYTLTSEKKRILLPLGDKDTVTVTILADNTGNEPPNTANLLLRDGAAEHAVVAYNDIGREAVIRIRKVPPRDPGNNGETSR